MKFGTLKFVPQQAVVSSLLYGHPPSENSSRMPRKPCPSLPWFSCLKNVVVRPVRIRTVRPIPANNTAANQNRKKSHLGICALALLGIVPFLMFTFLSQAISQLLLSSSPVCLSHIPKHVYVLFSFPVNFSLEIMYF
jgi:hypothetical protein